MAKVEAVAAMSADVTAREFFVLCFLLACCCDGGGGMHDSIVIFVKSFEQINRGSRSDRFFVGYFI